jgi:hypothetical protein
VLIKIDPNLLLDRTGSNGSTAQELITQSVQKGLRASLKSGDLLTGQLFVDLDFQKDAQPASVASLGNYQVLPTIPAAGLDELEEKVEALLDKFKALPVEKTVSAANDALAAVKDTAANLEKLTGPEGSLSKTLKNAEKVTAELSRNKDIGGTLHYLKETSAQLNTTIAELSVQFKKIGENLTEASDTVKHRPWRLVWPSTKKYNGEGDMAPPQPRPKPASRKKLPCAGANPTFSTREGHGPGRRSKWTSWLKSPHSRSYLSVVLGSFLRKLMRGGWAGSVRLSYSSRIIDRVLDGCNGLRSVPGKGGQIKCPRRGMSQEGDRSNVFIAGFADALFEMRKGTGQIVIIG